MKDSEIRLGILISGGGSTAVRIIEACGSGELARVTPAVVISSRRDAVGIAKARALGVPTHVVERRHYPTREAFGEALVGVLQTCGIDVVSQHGWLPLTPENVIYQYTDRIFNQHPGPLDPEHRDERGQAWHFGGKGMHGKAVHAAVLLFQKKSGRSFPTEATIHRVTPAFDDGRVVFRREVPIAESDSPAELAVRVLPVEHAACIEFLMQVADSSVVELYRKDPLILPEEREQLIFAKQQAQARYPKG